MTVQQAHSDPSLPWLGLVDRVTLSGGRSVTIRFVGPHDGEALRDYFRGMSQGSRYNRFLGAVGDLSSGEFAHMMRTGEDNHFAVVVEPDDGEGAQSPIVGEARYAFDAAGASCEFGLSVADGWRGLGLGRALLSNLECRASSFGALRLFGDTFASNEAMLALSQAADFARGRSPGDWRLIRIAKMLRAAPDDIPCANWRRAVGRRQQ